MMSGQGGGGGGGGDTFTDIELLMDIMFKMVSGPLGQMAPQCWCTTLCALVPLVKCKTLFPLKIVVSHL